MTITNGYRSDYDYGHDDTDDTMDRADGIGWGIIRKRKRMSDARIVAIAATTITAISAFIAFFSQYWLASERRLYGAKFVRLGLWATCFRSYVSPEDYEMSKYYAGCRWIFAEEYQNIKHILMPGIFNLTIHHNRTHTITLTFKKIIICKSNSNHIVFCFSFLNFF